ncbi:MAG TPA: endospore germination permease [Syntrophomonadaceae bacterium]|nr:endospore germination permease [Syntrophomonadaceae bacterium]
MNQISNVQLYCMLHATIMPLAFLILPMVSVHYSQHGAWAAFMVSILPTALLCYMYQYIVHNSSRPFPATLEEHLGQVLGKSIGFLYILVFLFITIFSITYFTSLISSSIVPDTPLSVYIGAMLLVSYYALKTGLENIGRVLEVIVLYVFIAVPLLVLFSIMQSHDFRALLPIFDASLSEMGNTVSYAFLYSGELIAILTLAFFSNDRKRISRPVNWTLAIYCIVITITTAAILMDLGPVYVNHVSFPTFKLIRSIKISDFIQNTDIIFISVFILGVFAGTTVKWFLACFSIQQVFGLRDYRFLAGPTAILIGIGALMTGKNIIAIQMIVHHVLPYIYGVFFVLIPLILFLVVLFKPTPDSEASSPSSG